MTHLLLLAKQNIYLLTLVEIIKTQLTEAVFYLYPLVRGEVIEYFMYIDARPELNRHVLIY